MNPEDLEHIKNEIIGTGLDIIPEWLVLAVWQRNRNCSLGLAHSQLYRLQPKDIKIYHGMN